MPESAKPIATAYRLLGKALRTFRLIEEGDRVLAALSGGKDSLFLLELLAKRKKILFPRFSLGAVHIRMSNIDYESDTSYLEMFCKSRDIPFTVLVTSFEPDRNSHRSPCFLCSWTRRKQIFDYAQKQGFNKIALGHHNDDVLHTLLMNQIYEGQYTTMPPLLRMEKMPLSIIRPLCMIPEKLIVAHAEASRYQPQWKRCPYEHESKRTQVRRLFEDMERLNPEVRHSLWHSLMKQPSFGSGKSE